MIMMMVRRRMMILQHNIKKDQSIEKVDVTVR
ncbi:hypothetical protein HRbin04_00415 [archaeon HR04]|nr:hypothetical protein HRbin04_00415 [archaeon HR04]